MAILCDGKSFYFFKFVDRQQTHSALPQLFLGQFPDGDLHQIIDELQPSTDSQVFVRQIRRTCEGLYYVFLSGYQSGLDAYWNRSVEKGKAQGKGRDSTPGWYKATVQANNAIEEAVSAWNLYDGGKLEESEDAAERAAQFLAERYVSRSLSCGGEC